MNMRGQWATSPDPSAIKINVTSAQATNAKNRRDFSPMTAIAGGYKDYYCFENYWQSGKVFDGLGADENEYIKIWWQNLKEPKRRCPQTKSKRCLYASWDSVEHFDYIQSRKKVYVPEYYELIRDREMTQYWQQKHRAGVNLIIYDFDGPRTDTGAPTYIDLSISGLINKINDESFPFGHGYIVAATIAGILPDEYTL